MNCTISYDCINLWKAHSRGMWISGYVFHMVYYFYQVHIPTTSLRECPPVSDTPTKVPRAGPLALRLGKFPFPTLTRTALIETPNARHYKMWASTVVVFRIVPSHQRALDHLETRLPYDDRQITHFFGPLTHSVNLGVGVRPYS
jgi:hypothetical protein